MCHNVCTLLSTLSGIPWRDCGSPTGVPTFSNPKSMQLILGKGGLGVGPTGTSLVTLLKNHSIKGLFLHEAEEIQR